MSKRARLREIWNHRRKDIKTATAAERRMTPEKERTYIEKKLQKKWMYAETSSEKPNENAYYRAVYDSRREWMETALKLLTAVYGYHSEPVQKYAKNCVSLLNRRGADRAELRWEPAPDRPEFIAMEWDMETE